jgi:hypothetical protein
VGDSQRERGKPLERDSERVSSLRKSMTGLRTENVGKKGIIRLSGKHKIILKGK